MLEKIVGILLEKFLHPLSQDQKAEKRVKEYLVILHECLVSCHSAYLQYVSDPNEMNLANWQVTVRDLTYAFDGVGLVLSTYSPETFHYLSLYVDIETEGYGSGEEALELRETVERLALLQSGKPKSKYDNEFREATTRLREFMKEHMTAGEIQRAQETFRRGGWEFRFR